MLIERGRRMGGGDLNRGCVPSKSLIAVTHRCFRVPTPKADTAC